MKKCSNCPYLWPDDYFGSCTECGGPMSKENAKPLEDLQARYAKQMRATKREGDQETAITRGRYDGIQIEDAVMDKARSMIVQKEEVRYEDA